MEKCESCDKTFRNKVDLKKHLEIIHNTAKTHECGTCGKCFKKKEYLKIHISNVHNDANKEKVKKIPCKICDKSFIGLYHLKSHI